MPQEGSPPEVSLEEQPWYSGFHALPQELRADACVVCSPAGVRVWAVIHRLVLILVFTLEQSGGNGTFRRWGPFIHSGHEVSSLHDALPHPRPKA